MAGPIGTLASTLLPLLRSVTAWLETAAAPPAKPAISHDVRRAALRDRYPDAPETWIDWLATRVADESDFQPEAHGAQGEDEPTVRPPAPRGDGPQRQEGPARIIQQNLTEPPMSSRDVSPRPAFAMSGEIAPPAAVLFSSDQAPAPTGRPAWPRPEPRPGVARRVEVAIKQAESPTEPNPAPRSTRGETAPPPRALPRFYPQGEAPAAAPLAEARASVGVDAPPPAAPPAPARAPETIARPRPVPVFKPTADKEADAPFPRMAMDRPVSQPAPAPRQEATRRPPLPDPARPSFTEVWHTGARQTLFSDTPAVDRWADLPAPPAPVRSRGFEEAMRVKRLADDQVERAWNG